MLFHYKQMKHGEIMYEKQETHSVLLLESTMSPTWKCLRKGPRLENLLFLTFFQVKETTDLCFIYNKY